MLFYHKTNILDPYQYLDDLATKKYFIYSLKDPHKVLFRVITISIPIQISEIDFQDQLFFKVISRSFGGHFKIYQTAVSSHQQDPTIRLQR